MSTTCTLCCSLNNSLQCVYQVSQCSVTRTIFQQDFPTGCKRLKTMTHFLTLIAAGRQKRKHMCAVCETVDKVCTWVVSSYTPVERPGPSGTHFAPANFAMSMRSMRKRTVAPVVIFSDRDLTDSLSSATFLLLVDDRPSVVGDRQEVHPMFHSVLLVAISRPQCLLDGSLRSRRILITRT